MKYLLRLQKCTSKMTFMMMKMPLSTDMTVRIIVSYVYSATSNTSQKVTMACKPVNITKMSMYTFSLMNIFFNFYITSCGDFVLGSIYTCTRFREKITRMNMQVIKFR